MINELSGTRALVRLILRRDRMLLAIWILLAASTPIAIASSFAQLYPTAAALRLYAAESMSTPAAVAVLGVVFSPTLGGLVAWRTGLQSALLIGPPSILFVIRHTRTEEEAGRRELLGGTAVGRHAALTAVLVVVLGANLAISAVIAGGLIALGLPVAGSVALGLSAGSAGWVFAAVAGLTAQVTQSPGTARGIALVVFGASYVLRMAGDAGGEGGALSWLSWLSPLGWVRLTRAFGDERWWVFGLVAGLTVVLAAADYALSARRDLGAGVLPPRLGPASASPGLRSPLAFAWRLHRGALLAWTIGFGLLGVLLGAVAQSIPKFVDTPQLNDWLAGMGAHDPRDAFLFMVLYILGQVAAAYAMSAALRMRVEEVELRAEPVLATSVSRLRWATSHLVVAAIGPAVVLAALGGLAGLFSGLSVGNVGYELPRLLARAMAVLPAAWVMVGIATALYGLLPRVAVPGTWAVLAAFLLLELAWELQRVSRSVFEVSPFAHVHWATDVTTASLIWLTAVAAILVATGLVGFQRRDLD